MLRTVDICRCYLPSKLRSLPRFVAATCFLCLIDVIFGLNFANAQVIKFKQSGGDVVFRSIVQSNNAGHKIVGLTAGGRVSDSSTATFTGNFSSIVIDQTGSAAQTLGANIAVSNSASVGFHMNTSVASSMVVNVSAGNYTSDVSLTGTGRKSVNIFVNASGKTVVQNIDLAGGPVELRLNQTNSADLILDYQVLSSFRDTVEINQSGLDTIASISGISQGASTMTMRLAGDDAQVYMDAILGFGSYLSYSNYRNGAVLGSESSPVGITVSDYSTVIITVN